MRLAVACMTIALAPSRAAADESLWTDGAGGPPPKLDAGAFTRVMRAAGPAVVSIVATPTARGGRAGGEESPGRNVGAGFVVRRDGLVVTNRHVLGDGTDIRMRTGDGRTRPAVVVGWDRRTDLALLRVLGAPPLVTVPLGDSDRVEIGEWVVAIGSPLALDQTLTAGIVSAKGRHDLPVDDIPYQDFIQTDASINPGNSGGPLLNLRGEVIGILTAVNRAGQGIGFATPINMARELLPRLHRDGRIRRSWMGVVLESGDLTEDLARAFGLPDRRGALVSEVLAGSPAEVAGLKAGDVVVEFEGRRLRRASDLPWLVSLAGGGREVDLVVLRQGARRRLRAKLVDMPNAEDPPPPAAAPPAPIGVDVSEAVGEEGAANTRAVVVTRVAPGSAAARAGIEEGDAILELNGKAVRSVDDWFEGVKRVRTGGMLRVRVRRQGAQRWLAFEKG